MFGPANIEAVLHDAEHDELDELEDCEQTSTQEESQNTTNVTWERSLLNYMSQIRTVKYVFLSDIIPKKAIPTGKADKVVILFKFPLTYCTISVPTSLPWTAISVPTLDVAPVWLIAHVMSAEEMGVTLALPSLPSSSPSSLLSTLQKDLI